MVSTKAFQPDWASAPGETITEVLNDRGLSVAAFARKLHVSNRTARGLIDGTRRINIELASALSGALGASVEFWMAREFDYRQHESMQFPCEREWVRQLPVAHMVRFGWIDPATNLADKISGCLRFFGVESVEEWQAMHRDLAQTVDFRISDTVQSRPGAVAAWLRKGELEAQSMSCRNWDSHCFEASLPKIRSMTRSRDPAAFVPELQRICAQSGVAVVIARAPRGCPASGATKFLRGGQALLLLSFRYLSDDHFWFTFFHEAGHLLLHGPERVFLETANPKAESEDEEHEANEFAAHLLVPATARAEMHQLPLRKREIMRFAKDQGVSPGIVVGQLQKIGMTSYSKLNYLKRKYSWA